MTRPDIEGILARLDTAPRAPWTWDGLSVPGLEGRGGDPEVYEYGTPVLEASHWGECGCRSACTLELELADGAADLIAAGPTDLAAMVAYALALEAELDTLRDGVPR